MPEADLLPDSSAQCAGLSRAHTGSRFAALGMSHIVRGTTTEGGSAEISVLDSTKEASEV